MATQIPKLNPLGQEQPVPTGRIEAQPRDVTSTQGQLGETFQRSAFGMVEHYQKEQIRAGDIIADSQALKYQAKFDELYEGQNGLKYKRGEQAFTTEYENTAKKLKEYKESVIASNPDMSDYAKTAISKKFDKLDGDFHATLSTFAAKSQNDFENATTEGTADLLKRKAIDDLAYYNANPNDPISLNYFTNRLAEIKQNRQKQADRQGNFHINEDGSKTYDDETNLKIAKDQSEAVYNAIENLASTKGGITNAAKLAEKFHGYLDDINKPALKKQIAEASLRQESSAKAYSIIAKALPRDKAIGEIDKLADKNPELAAETLKAYHTHETQVERLSNIESNNTYNQVAKYIADKQKSNKPFLTDYEMKSDPFVAGMIPKIKESKKLDYLTGMIEIPKMSNPQAKSRVNEMMFKNPEEFKNLDLPTSGLLTGLSKEDRRRVEKAHADMNTETKSERRIIYKQMDTELYQSMLDAKLIKKNMFGKLSADDETKLHKAQDQMVDIIVDMPLGTDPAQRKEWINSFVVKSLKEKQAAPPLPEVKPFNGTSFKTPTATLQETGVTATPARSLKSNEENLNLALADYRKEFQIKGSSSDEQRKYFMQTYFPKWKKDKGITK